MGLLAQVKQHDYGLPLIVDLSYRDAVLNLTTTIALDTPVVFIMTPDDSTTPTIDRAAATVTDLDVSQQVVTVRYDWTSPNLDTVGRYYGEFEFTLTNGPGTAPTHSYLIIDIEPDLG